MAIPAGVSWAVARRAESSQWVADASQNFTWPGFTGVGPETTAAVSVTTVSEATDDTPEPALVTVSVVVVAAGAAQAFGEDSDGGCECGGKNEEAQSDLTENRIAAG